MYQQTLRLISSLLAVSFFVSTALAAPDWKKAITNVDSKSVTPGLSELIYDCIEPCRFFLFDSKNNQPLGAAAVTDNLGGKGNVRFYTSANQVEIVWQTMASATFTIKPVKGDQ